MAKKQPERAETKLNFVQRDPKELKPSIYNPRSISAAAFASLKASIQRWGLVEPIAFQTSTAAVVGGHQRLKAAIELGINPVPCIAMDIPDLEARALNLALNKISGEWNTHKLIESLEALRSENFDIDLTGFEDIEVEELLTDGPVELNRMELTAPPGTLWVLLSIPVNSFGEARDHLAALEDMSELTVRTARD